jgi:hypothetical protein
VPAGRCAGCVGDMPLASTRCGTGLLGIVMYFRMRSMTPAPQGVRWAMLSEEEHRCQRRHMSTLLRDTLQ